MQKDKNSRALFPLLSPHFQSVNAKFDILFKIL